MIFTRLRLYLGKNDMRCHSQWRWGYHPNAIPRTCRAVKNQNHDVHTTHVASSNLGVSDISKPPNIASLGEQFGWHSIANPADFESFWTQACHSHLALHLPWPDDENVWHKRRSPEWISGTVVNNILKGKLSLCLEDVVNFACSSNSSHMAFTSCLCESYPKSGWYQLQLVCRFVTPFILGLTLHWSPKWFQSQLECMNVRLSLDDALQTQKSTSPYGRVSLVSSSSSTQQEWSTESQLVCVYLLLWLTIYVPWRKFAWTPTIHQSVYHNLGQTLWVK